MNFGFQTKPKVRLSAGLDIGVNDIKVVEVSYGDGKPLVTAFGSAKIAPSSRGEDISGAIKGLATSSNLSVKDINISVSGPPVIIRFLAMPRMNKEELSGAIRFEAEKHIPFNISECVTDFQVLREYPKENKTDVLLVAVKKDYVEGRVKIVRDAGLNVGVVDVDGLAVANAFLKNYADIAGQEKTSLLLDIGANYTHLAILKGRILCLVRDVSIGFKDFNSAAEKDLNAENKNAQVSQDILKEKPQEASLHVRGVLNNLFDEIRLSCSYYENQCGRAIDAIFISGEGSGIAELPGFFQESFGLKPVCLNPFQAFNTVNVGAGQIDKCGSLFAIAVGLALR